MNKLYEFLKQVDVILHFCLTYITAINDIVWIVCEITCFIVKMVKIFRKKHKQKKVAQNEDVTE